MFRAAFLCLFLLTPGLPSARASLRLNEIVAVNQGGLRDERGARPDWIELHNPGPAAVDLAGWSLSDDPKRPRRWTFRAGRLEPGAFLVVFASGTDRQPVEAPALEPDAVPGLTLWLRADAIDPESTAHVRASGTLRYVRRWPDLTPGRRDAVQETAALQPRWIREPAPAVRFDGRDDLLRLPAILARDRFTLFAVIEPTAGHEIDPQGTTGVGGTSGQRWAFGAGHGGDLGAGAGLSAGTNGISLYEHGSSYMPAVIVLDRPLRPGPVVVTVAYLDRQPALAVDGHELAGTVSPRNVVSAPTEIGSGSYGAFAGNIREIVLFNRALTEPERRGVESGLARRHGREFERYYHADFRLDGDGEPVLLTRPDGTLADELHPPALPRDIAWGRQPDGAAAQFYFPEPTPGAPNTAAGAHTFLQAPVFSHAPGFHRAAFDLALTSIDPGAEIRYTLDGGEPTPNSTLYAGPLRIADRTAQANQLSRIPTAPGWQAPSGNVFKGMVVRARAFRPASIPSATATASYFVHPRGRDRYTLPVVSLATDARHFFDPATGIYVPGQAPGGNYAQAGDAWERPVHVEFFETDGRRVIAQDSGVRIHGNTSFNFPIKALRLHPENQRGTGPFRHRIFPDLEADTYHRLLLRPSGHDHHLTLMRDGLMQGLVRELDLDLQGYRPAILFVNGEYWGLHNLQEALEKHYFAAHHPGVDADAVDYLEGYPPGTFVYEGDATWFHGLTRFLETNRLDHPTAQAWVQGRMELANYRDYKLAEIFHYRWDIGNHRLWRPRTPEGRLRWILFDCDVGFGGFWSEPQPWSFDMLRACLEPSGSLHGHNNAATVFLLDSLLDLPEFRADFINRAADLLNATLSTDRILSFIDRMSAEIQPEIDEHTRRWRVPSSLSAWRDQVEALRRFGRLRPGYLRQHLIRQFRLAGTVKVQLAVHQPAGGTLRCNTLRLLPGPDAGWLTVPEPARDPAPWTTSPPGARAPHAVVGTAAPARPPWEGLYFRHHPIVVEALPSAGWRFAGWEELPGVTNAQVTLALSSDVRLTARFEPLASLRLVLLPHTEPGAIDLLLEGPSNAGVILEESSDLRSWRAVRELVLPPDGAERVRMDRDPGMQFLRAQLAPE